ncbi:spermidine synthase [Demequina mangrovi]|uniref:Spermidine synthase n=1 Tax=Demequina mangrovi TaxID=1043493 RepID=A0A1H6Z3C6_9MICO|nr:fused MFS/spermidine synthase [Demequina mangrovi]SEJ47226.1 spermidine synthase [Demequina mangrovi]
MPRQRTGRVAPDVERGVEFAIATGVAELRDEPDGTTFLWVNGVPSSPLDSDPDQLAFEYMRHLSAAVAAWDPPSRMLALHVGAAACAFPRHLAHRFPDSGHIAVDVDATLPELVRTWWDLPRAPRLRIRAQDGFDAVATRRDASLDLVVRDAFAGDSTPAALASPEWWGHAARTLRPRGLVLANVGTRPGGRTARDDAAAARAALGEIVAIGEHAVLKGKRRGNVVIAGPVDDRLDLDALRRYAASAPLPTGVSTAWAG